MSNSDICPSCASARTAVRVTGSGFVVLTCGHCGLCWERSSVSQTLFDPYSSLYSVDLVRFESLSDSVDATSRIAFNRAADDLVAAGKTNGCLLDIGCGYGSFVACMRERGWKASGIDVAGNAVRWAAAQGLDCRETSIEGFVPDDKYDVIVLRHVLEHLADPLAVLRRVSGWLTDHGIIYIRVPNAGSRVMRARSNFIGHLKPFEHLFYFTPEALEALMRRAGLAPIVRVDKRHLLSEIINYKIRSRMVLRASWTGIRYSQEGKGGGASVLRRLYQSFLGLFSWLHVGPPDQEIVAIAHRVER